MQPLQKSSIAFRIEGRLRMAPPFVDDGRQRSEGIGQSVAQQDRTTILLPTGLESGLGPKQGRHLPGRHRAAPAIAIQVPNRTVPKTRPGGSSSREWYSRGSLTLRGIWKSYSLGTCRVLLARAPGWPFLQSPDRPGGGRFLPQDWGVSWR